MWLGQGSKEAYLVWLKCQGEDVAAVAPSLARSSACAKSCFGGAAKSELQQKVSFINVH